MVQPSLDSLVRRWRHKRRALGRIVNSLGSVISDERVKRDPVLAFTQPASAAIDDVTLRAVISVPLQLQDFDGEPRTDSGMIHFRLRDRAIAEDDGIAFTRQLIEGQLALVMEFDTPGDFAIAIEPPLVSDLQLAEPIRVRVS